MRSGTFIWDTSLSQDLMFLYTLTTQQAKWRCGVLEKALSPQTREVHARRVTLAETMEQSTRAELKSKGFRRCGKE